MPPSDQLQRVHFDEAGYTGYDLLNPDQPFFCVGSTNVTDDLAEEILESSFPSYRGDEFKFSQLWASPRQRRNFLSFARAVATHQRKLFAYTCDKKFTLLTKIVDTLVEPLVHEAGYDFYASNFNRGYVNMLHFGLREFASEAFYNEVVSVYAKFSRNPTTETLSGLVWKYHLMAESCPEQIKPFMDMLAMSASLYLELNSLARQKSSNDIQFTCVLASVHYWRAHLDAEFEVVHDKSSNFFRKIEWWNQITSPDVAPATVPIANQQTMSFPLRVVATRAVDSRNSRALQLSDVLAGLSARLLHADHRTWDLGFRAEIIQAGFGELMTDGIRPDETFIQGPIQTRNGPDMVDQFMAAISKR
ncbi:DUF3800 domain-containing protein [uncultured Reyranella sp.]|jgi:hypothetical protein|uniref:DUF3800 domain-containing protein n=1 Tax=uncultured Reyranella sp. TaxID=735512 RepID=UPI00259CED16|nr:DUF3800 domain-containing protein [uncultured Reyranella sp.]